MRSSQLAASINARRQLCCVAEGSSLSKQGTWSIVLAAVARLRTREMDDRRGAHSLVVFGI